MTLRRVVTGHDRNGVSKIVSDGPIPRTYKMSSLPGAETSLAWATEPGQPPAHDGSDPTGDVSSYIPKAGATRFLVVTIAPDDVYKSPAYDAELAAKERPLLSPGFAQYFDPDQPGMHTTPTQDYGIVVVGEVRLEMTDGSVTTLQAGDIVVQNQTRHAWRNTSVNPTTVAFVLLGSPI